LLDAESVLGKRFISTRLSSNVTIREENAAAALEVMSRFAADPKWIIYLPPTMSPSETSQETGFLEYPKEAFTYFRSAGIPQVICEEKHMGSRAVVIVCRDKSVSAKRFGVVEPRQGVVYTRTGRLFFDKPQIEDEFLQIIAAAIEKSGLWSSLNTDWVCLDCELMPWSAKAQELLKTQYAATGAAALAALEESIKTLETAVRRDVLSGNNEDHKPAGTLTNSDIGKISEKFHTRLELMRLYIDAYRRYCWPINSINDFKLAPFHLLASEGKVHFDKNHQWHMDTLSQICLQETKLLMQTPYHVVDVTDSTAEQAGIDWWKQLTDGGGEGMVIKPMDFIAKGKKGLAQPALKCRGREYLRIIYGPEYTTDQNLARLRSRGLSIKRSLAIREFSLGLEALERFVRREPLRRVHECVFGVLALESEPVDPRL
jgi:protein phosphatase